MPQMAPISWLSLFIAFYFLFILSFWQHFSSVCMDVWSNI